MPINKDNAKFWTLTSCLMPPPALSPASSLCSCWMPQTASCTICLRVHPKLCRHDEWQCGCFIQREPNCVECPKNTAGQGVIWTSWGALSSGLAVACKFFLGVWNGEGRFQKIPTVIKGGPANSPPPACLDGLSLKWLPASTWNSFFLLLS